MGTCYYLRVNPCEHCGRSDKDWLICKNYYIFRGYEHTYDAPSSLPILTWEMWKKELARPHRAVYDEYLEPIPTDEFIKDVESVPTELRRKEFDTAADFKAKNGLSQSIGRYWMDSDHFSFTNTDFF